MKEANSIVLLSTDEHEIAPIINSLKSSTSPGLDEIPASVLKYAKTYISLPPSKLINSSFVNGIFPSELKKARVIPIYKADNPTILSNYWPISI